MVHNKNFDFVLGDFSPFISYATPRSFSRVTSMSILLTTISFYFSTNRFPPIGICNSDMNHLSHRCPVYSSFVLGNTVYDNRCFSKNYMIAMQSTKWSSSSSLKNYWDTITLMRRYKSSIYDKEVKPVVVQSKATEKALKFSLNEWTDFLHEYFIRNKLHL